MKLLQELLDRYPQLMDCQESIAKSFTILLNTFQSSGKLLIAGNGGSAADAGHISGELLKSFCKQRKLPDHLQTTLSPETIKNLQGALPAIPLPDFVSFHTAYANDCNADYNFAQLILALGRKNDTLLAISTSGNSKNILHAAEVARANGMKILGLTGKSGGLLKTYCDRCICVPETETFKIQELHLPVYHCLCQMIEESLF